MNKIHIAMVGTKGIPAKWGGIEKYIEEVGKRLVERGHKVTVFGSRWFCNGYGKKEYHGIHIKALPVIPWKATSAMNNAFLAAMVIAFGNYDIVNFHGYAPYYFLPVVRKMGLPAIVTAHGVESGWMNPKYSLFDRYIIKYAFKLGVTHADSVITVADHLRIKIKQNFGVKAHVLPSGLDNVICYPAQLIKEKYGLNGLDYLLFLGRIDPIKRVGWLLDLPHVLKRKIKIVIAGGAQDPTTEDYLHNLKQRAGSNPQVIFTGPVFGREKAELFNHCLALLAPSKNEGLPITILEALSYGKLCIASRIPAHSEIIEDGITGLLFPRYDKEAFLDKVRWVLNEPKESIEAIGKKGKMNVTQKFNWGSTTERLEILSMNLLNGRKRIKCVNQN